MKMSRWNIFFALITIITLIVIGVNMNLDSDSRKPTTFEEVQEIAKKQDKNIFLYFGATWCPPCQMMKASVLPDERVKAKLDKLIVVIIDTDNARDLAIKYNVAGIPCFMIVTPDGGVLKRHSGLFSVNEMTEWLSL